MTVSQRTESILDHDRRLVDACRPMPVRYFKAAKALFYSALMLLVTRWSLQSGADATIVFSGFVMFLVVYITETKDVELAGLVSATFYRDRPLGDQDTSDED